MTHAPPAPAPPKLRRHQRVPHAAYWREVIPPTLAALLDGVDELAQHRELYERFEAAARRATELRKAHQQALAADRQAEADFGANRRTKLPAATAPKAEDALAEAERAADALAKELPASADRLLRAALPRVEAAAVSLEGRRDRDDERIEGLVGEALELLDQRSRIEHEARWLGQCLWESSVPPFDSTKRPVSASAPSSELRQVLAALQYEREQAAHRRRERAIELEMNFDEQRRPRRLDGRPLAVRRREAEEIVRQREAARR